MSEATNIRAPKITLRQPNGEDGSDVWELIRKCRPLDENSMYCNLIQCDHFGETCVLAEIDGRIGGWISAYLLPGDDETLFVWQVAVDEIARGQGLGRKMLLSLLERDVCANVQRIQTTITKDNEASWALFGSFADRTDADLESEAHFKRDVHFDGAHATEHMVTITLPEVMSAAA
ncbi:diaminobutyrate acetyltransferase [Profundibacterium mesophilum]|uniref:L-2,4-diaminobutyric acid acetyltransferase n=1 Tax=Profundibacterium mesophilum KAUST100406-0324 TaxID=1037889 RepID=A0A921TBZ0_9RHOB|nr:diaminobutyrate acetyltransferase [Profundibacterium mesophilum]KAF0675043.1 L-24-diaminobutyric acid acetyltransferase [Profundibacterium mesophilum KAUST100406-0324]